MSRGVIVSLVAGVACALFATALTAGSLGGILFAYLSPLPLFVAGLGYGVQGAAIAAVTALAVLFVLSGSLMPVSMVLVLVVAPVLFLTRLALLNRPAGDGGAIIWYPPGRLLAWLTTFICALVTGGLLFLESRTMDGARAALAEAARPQVESLVDAGVLQTAQVQQVVDQVAAVAPGIIASTWLMLLAICGSLAQGLLSGFGTAIRPSAPMSKVGLPKAIPLIFAITLAVGVVIPGLLGYIASNLAVALSAPLFIQGLAVVHALVAQWPARLLLLIVFYLLLIVLGGPAVFVIAVGLVEPFARLRERVGAVSRQED